MLTWFGLGGWCALLVGGVLTLAQTAPDKAGIQIEVRDGQGVRVAGVETSLPRARNHPAVLAVEREYQPGDRIVVSGPGQLIAQLDQGMAACELHLAGESFSFAIPHGRKEPETGSPYAPEAFAGTAHRMVVRELSAREAARYRNVALNPCDQLGVEDAPELQRAFPHASTNSVARGLPDFSARNAIDGVTENGHHGVWPYQSWGPERRDDLWWRVDFGRTVEVDKVRLMVRADFPHDSYWKSAVLEFSDGSEVPIAIGASAGFQEFRFARRRVTWMRITRLVAEDPAKWCSFIEVEAWGRDAH